MSLSVNVQNVAGFVGRKQFKDFKRGLNRVRAPNALGKTSFTKALELLVLSERELSGKGHYSNLYVGSEEPITVELSGEIQHERRFRRIGTTDLHLIEGEPLSGPQGIRALRACFATPGNQLINDVLEGRPIRDYVRTFAGSEHYDKVISVLNDITDNFSAKLQHYRDALVRLEETKRLKEEMTKDLDLKRKSLAKMPILDDKEMFEDYDSYIRSRQQLNSKVRDIAEAQSKIGQLEEDISEFGDEIKNLERQIQLIKKQHPRMEARLEEIANTKPKKEEDLRKIKVQKAKAEDKLESAHKSEILFTKYGEDVCYSCGRPMTKAQLREWVAKVQAEIDDLGTAETKLRRAIEDLEEEQYRLERDQETLAKTQREVLQKQKSLANRDGELRQTRKALESLKRERKELLTEIEKLSKSEEMYKKFEKRQEMLTSIEQQEANISRLKERVELLNRETLGVEEYQGKYDMVQQLIRHLESRKNIVEEEMRTIFNAKVNELYKKLGFRDFETIEIAPDFRMTVTREKEGKIVENFPLDALATSERITIAIALLLAAKQSYVKDFPFFVLDELITSYDPERFNVMKDYLKQSDDYVILTELGAKGTDIEVIHEP